MSARDGTAPRAVLEVDGAGAAVGAPLSVRIRVEGAAGAAGFPGAGEELGSFLVASSTPRGPAEQELLLLPTLPGARTIPAATVRLEAPGRAELVLRTKPVEVEVASALVPGEPAVLADGLALEAIPGSGAPLLALGAAALAAALLAAIYLARRRRRAAPARPRPRPTPADHEGEALRRLAALADVDTAPGPERLRARYAALADVLRRYLAGRFLLPVLECTAAEALPRLAALAGAADAAFVAALLPRAEQVKYSPEIPAPGEVRALAAAIERFVRARQPPAAAGPAGAEAAA